MKRTTIAIIGLTTAAALALTGCQPAAKTASDNLSTAADNFEVQRKIVGINTRSDKFLFYVEGRCSIDRQGDLIVTCKHSDTDYRKHILMEATDVFVSVTQLAPIAVSEYHTRVILKPQGTIPDLELKVQL